MTYTHTERQAILVAYETLLRAAEAHSPEARRQVEWAAAEERNQERDQTSARCLIVRAAFVSRYGCKLAPRELYRLSVGVRMAHMVADVLDTHARPTTTKGLRAEAIERLEAFRAAGGLALEYHLAALARESAGREGVRV